MRCDELTTKAGVLTLVLDWQTGYEGTAGWCVRISDTVLMANGGLVMNVVASQSRKTVWRGATLWQDWRICAGQFGEADST